LDPVWAPIASYEHGRARSATFAATLEQVFEGVNITPKYLRTSREALRKILIAVVSEDLANLEI
jgi:hypothetical protein